MTSAIEPVPDATFDNLRAVIRQLHESSETDRIALHRALHDRLGGLVVSATMDIAALAHDVAGRGPIDSRLLRAQSAMVAAVDLNRRLSEDLRPSLLDNFGLFAAFRWYIKQECVHMTAVCTQHYPADEMQLSPAAATTLYRIGQESLARIFGEPDLKSVDVDMKLENAEFHMTLGHEHSGIEPIDMFSETPEFMHSVTERTRLLGGKMWVRRSAASTELIHRFPLNRILSAASLSS